jgi:putative Mn2+ efflux pump MntP
LNVWDLLAVAVGLGMDAMSVCLGIGVRWHGPRQRFRLAWHMGLFQFLMPLLGYLAGVELAGVLQRLGSYLAAALVVGVGVKMLWEAIRSHPGAVAEHEAHMHFTDGVGWAGLPTRPHGENSAPYGRPVGAAGTSTGPVGPARPTADATSPASPAPAQGSATKDPTRGWSLLALAVATSLDALVVGFSLGVKGAASIWQARIVIGVVAAGMSLAGVTLGRRLGKTFGKAAEIVGALILVALGVSFLWW